MRRGVGLFTAISVGMALVLAIPVVMEAVSRAELFRVVDVSVEGARYLTPEEIVGATAVPPGASVWDDPADMEARLRAHPMVSDAHVRRKLPGTLVLQVEERAPVGLVPMPALTPVDGRGKPLPLDPAGRLVDLPLVQPGRGHASGGAELTAAQLETLTSELARLGELDPAVLAAVSEVALDAWGDVLLHLGEPRVTLRYRPPLLPGSLSDALLVLGDALERNPDRTPVSVDLRFADQVVVRYGNRTR